MALMEFLSIVVTKSKVCQIIFISSLLDTFADLTQLPFEAVVYLLFEGTFPNQDQLTNFMTELQAYSRIPDRIRRFIASFPRTAHPMTIFMASMAAMAAEFPSLNPAVSGQGIYSDEKLRRTAARRCFALSTALCGTLARHR